MLGLKLPTDPRWVNIVEKNIEEILTDTPSVSKKQQALLFPSLSFFLKKQNWFRK